MAILLFFRGFSVLTLLLLMFFGLIPISVHSQTYDEWYAKGWDAGCVDGTNELAKRTEGKNTPFIKGYEVGYSECSSGSTSNSTLIKNVTTKDTSSLPLNRTTESTQSDTGYSQGCNDAEVSDPHDRYLEQPGNGPDFQTEEFMNEYYKGFYGCGGGTSYGGSLGSPESVPFEEAPLINPEDESESSQPSQSGGMDWIKTCNDLQTAVVSSCDVLVNPDNTLTKEGERAVGCIRNGIALAGGGTLLLSLPTPLVVAALQFLEEPTGCGGIVEWGLIGDVDDLQGIINRLT